jgi:hypothetical protein
LGNPPEEKVVLQSCGHDRFRVQAPALIGDHFEFLNHVKGEIGTTGTAVVGFDFPLGIPSLAMRRWSASRYSNNCYPTGAGRLVGVLLHFSQAIGNIYVRPLTVLSGQLRVG